MATSARDVAAREQPASPCAFTDYFNVMAKERDAPKPDSMTLGACYNLFDGEELLESSIKSVRAEVAYVCVVYQTGMCGCAPRLPLVSARG